MSQDYKYACCPLYQYDPHLNNQCHDQLQQLREKLDSLEVYVGQLQCPQTHLKLQFALRELFDHLYYNVCPMIEAHRRWEMNENESAQRNYSFSCK